MAKGRVTSVYLSKPNEQFWQENWERLNLSGVLNERLDELRAARAGCSHDQLVCGDCGATVAVEAPASRLPDDDEGAAAAAGY